MTTTKQQTVSEKAGVDMQTDEEAGRLLSVVIAVRDPERAAPVEELYKDYKEQIESVGLDYEFIFAVKGDAPALIDALQHLRQEREPIRILKFSRSYGGATILAESFKRAAGSILLTLPAYHQIKPESIPSLFPPLEDNDMVVARRSPRVDGFVTGLQVKAFHGLLRGLTGFDFHDLGCSVAVFKRSVLDSVNMYGDQHRFLPVLAGHYGYKVEEVSAPQTDQDTFQGHFSVGKHVNRILDLFSIFFVTKFTRKPLRFFGVASLLSLLVGGGVTLNLTVQRLFMGVPLRDKPMLLLGILLIVLGVLLFAIGLIGEMVIFTHSDDLEEYKIEEFIE